MMESPRCLLRRIGIMKFGIFVVVSFCTTVFAEPSKQVFLIDLPTNGSYLIETAPIFPVVPVVRVAAPLPGQFWRVTIAANCSILRGSYSRGTVPKFANVVLNAGEISHAETTEADEPGSFQVIIHNPFDEPSGQKFFFMLEEFLDAAEADAVFPIQLSIRYESISSAASSFPVGQVLTLPLNGALDRALLAVSWIPGNSSLWGIHYRVLSGQGNNAAVDYIPGANSRFGISSLRRGIPHYLNLRSFHRTSTVYNNDLFVYSRVETITHVAAPGALNVEAVADLPILLAVSNSFGSATSTNITLTISNTTSFECNVVIEIVSPSVERLPFLPDSSFVTTFTAALGSRTLTLGRANQFGTSFYIRIRYLPTTGVTAQSLAAQTLRAGLRLDLTAAEWPMLSLSLGQTLSGPSRTLFNFSSEVPAARSGQYMLTLSSSSSFFAMMLSRAAPTGTALSDHIYLPNNNFTMLPSCGPDREVARIDSPGSITLYREDIPTLTYPSSFTTNELGYGLRLFKLPSSAPYPLKVTATRVSGDAAASLWYTGPFNSSVCPSQLATVCTGDDYCSFYVTCADEFILLNRFLPASAQFNITLEAVTPTTVVVSRFGQIVLDLPTIGSALIKLEINDSSAPVTIASSPSFNFRVRPASGCGAPLFSKNVHAPVSGGMLIEVGSQELNQVHYLNLSPYNNNPVFEAPPLCDTDLTSVYSGCRSRVSVPFRAWNPPASQKLEDAFYSFSVSYSHINMTDCYKFMLDETCKFSYFPCAGERVCYETCMNRAFNSGCSIGVGSAVCQVLAPCLLSDDVPFPSNPVMTYFSPRPVAPPVASPVVLPTVAPPVASPVVPPTVAPLNAPFDNQPPLINASPAAATPTATSVSSSSSLAVSLTSTSACDSLIHGSALNQPAHVRVVSAIALLLRIL